MVVNNQTLSAYTGKGANCADFGINTGFNHELSQKVSFYLSQSSGKT